MPKRKYEKELKRRYGQLAESMEPYYHHLDLRPFSELDDDAFAYVMARVKGVNMLDVNETEITNESIKLLTRLEYVNELRAKGCSRLDNGCVDYLNRLPSLQFLHLNSTGVTIDGLLQLNNLGQLKTLLFSSSETDKLEEKMLQLKKHLPACDLVVNSKPWIFEDPILPADSY